MSNVSKAKATAALAAQCAAYKDGIETFRAFLAKHQFEARDSQGRAMPCLAAKDVTLMLDCITADVEDAADALAPTAQKDSTAHKGAVA
jgi:hypothetical protein